MSALQKLERPSHRVQTLWKLNDLTKKGIIFLDAPYQRDVVWQKNKMCDLIESIMNNYYIPPLVFSVKKAADGKIIRICIDGKQRLSSVIRFMKNEIPYIVVVDGVQHEYYYAAKIDRSQKNVSGREYLSKELRERFHDSEFVCVEYTNLDMESEIEIFSRVQLGVPLTSAEKLKANASASAMFCNELYNNYRTKLDMLFPDVRFRIFQHIAMLVLTIRENSASFTASRQGLARFLQDQTYEPTEDLRRKTTEVLDIIVAIAQSDYLEAFTHVEGKPKQILAMEFVCFGLYLSQCRRRSRSIKEFSQDCQELRTYMYNHVRSPPPRLGDPSYKVALEWIDEKLEQLGMTPAAIRLPAEPSLTPDTENQEEEEDVLVDSVLAQLHPNSLMEHKPAPGCLGPNPSSSSTTAVATSTPTNDHHHLHHARANRPVARRGAKVPRYY